MPRGHVRRLPVVLGRQHLDPVALVMRDAAHVVAHRRVVGGLHRGLGGDGLEVADHRGPLPVDEERREQRPARTSGGARARRRARGPGRARPCGSRCRPSGCRSGRRRPARRRRRRPRSAAASPPSGSPGRPRSRSAAPAGSSRRRRARCRPPGRRRPAAPPCPAPRPPARAPARLRSATEWATAAQARKSAATGLASGVRIARTIAGGPPAALGGEDRAPARSRSRARRRGGR